MNKSIVAIVVAVIVVLALAYFWGRGPAVNPGLENPLPASSLSPEDASLAAELQAIESVNLDKEFRDIDTELNQL